MPFFNQVLTLQERAELKMSDVAEYDEWLKARHPQEYEQTMKELDEFITAAEEKERAAKAGSLDIDDGIEVAESITVEDGIITNVETKIPKFNLTPSEDERKEDIIRIASTLDIDPDPAKTLARQRSRRSHMLRKLKNRFPQYAAFTPVEAAEKCNMGVNEMLAYLNFESAVPGSLIQRVEEGKFWVISPWL